MVGPHATGGGRSAILHPPAVDEFFPAGLAMHPFIAHRPNPQQILSHSERLAWEARGRTLELVFQGITAISLGVMTTKILFDMIHKAAEKRHPSANSWQSRER